MLSRLKGPFSSIQSPALRLPRWSPPPTSVDAAVFVPDWLRTFSTSFRFWRTLFCATVVRAGTDPSPWSVYEALITPQTFPPWETSAGSVGRTPLHPVVVASAWPCESWASTKVTATSAQLIAPSSGSLTVTVNGMLSPKANVPPSIGVVTVTVGAVLPTVIVVFAEPIRPFESVTVSFAT